MIFLQILKIIGIVLACIVGLVILILLLVLLVPLTYKIDAEGENADIKASFTAKLIFGLVSFKLRYEDKKAEYKAKVAFKTVFQGEFGQDKAEAVKEVVEEEIKPEEASAEPKPEETLKAEEKYKAEEKPVEETPPEKTAPEEESSEEKGKLEAFKEKVRAVINKIKDIYEKIKKVKYILGAPVTKRAWKYIKARLLDLLNHIKPRSFIGRIDFGLDDPATTAEVYGIAGSVACLLDDRLLIVPDFENKGIKLDIEIKGRIFLGYVLLLGLKVWRNKDLKRVLKYIRRNF